MKENVKISPARIVAYKVLNEVLFSGAYSNISISKHLNISVNNKEDRALASNIVYGSLKKKNKIDYIIDKVSSIERNSLDNRVYVSIYMGIYQILYLDKVPEYAIVNDSVNIVKLFVGKKAIGFVNGLLRNVIRNKKEYSSIEINNFKDNLYYEYCFNYDVVDILLENYSEDEILFYAKACEKAPNISIRVNTLKVTTESLIEKMSNEGVIVEKGFVPNSLIIKNSINIASLSSYKEGLFFVQDLGAMMVGHCLSLQKNLNVLDMCAAPGGKSFLASILMDGTGEITSCDIYPKKIDLIKGGAKQLSLDNIKAVKRDALIFREEEKNKYDRIICDVPCSCLGVVRRKPEILFNICRESLNELLIIQKNILSNAIEYLKIGGVLIYSTCTINKKENEDIVKDVINVRNDVVLEKIDFDFKLNSLHSETKDGFLNLRPEIDGTDGFFIAKIIKIK